MNSIEEIKKKKLQDLMNQQPTQHDQQQQILQQIQALENVVKQYLTKEAYQRYGNLKISHTEKSIQLLTIIGQLINAGQITEKIDDAKLKDLLIRLTPEKKETKITKI